MKKQIEKGDKFMNVVFLEDCAADGCYKKNIGNGKQMCKEHEEMYNNGKPFKAFYGKTVLKAEFQTKQKVEEGLKNG